MSVAKLLSHLPTDLLRRALADLHSNLPPPASDTSEARADWFDMAVTEFAALCPIDETEAMLVSLVVGAHAHARSSLYLADRATDRKTADRARAVARKLIGMAQADLLWIQNRRRQAWAASQSPEPASTHTAPPAADARQRRAERIRALDLRLVEPPETRH